jgi:hypothetical protein
MIDAPDTLQRSLADRYRIEREIAAGGMAIITRGAVPRGD